MQAHETMCKDLASWTVAGGGLAACCEQLPTVLAIDYWPASLASAASHMGASGGICARCLGRTPDDEGTHRLLCMQAVHDLAKEDKESAWVGRLLCQVSP